MKMPKDLGFKFYTPAFALISLSGLISISTPGGVTHNYYNILARMHPASTGWYLIATLSAILTCLALIPLCVRVFDRQPFWIDLFKLLFILRVVTTLLGSNYEILVIRATFVGNPLIAIILVSLWIAFMFPSFKEHYLYAFHHS